MFRKNIVRKYIRFYGQVQAAQHYGVTGWVRNEYDDSVSMEIQGTERQIDDVVSSLERGSYIRIDHMEVKTINVDPDERGFNVKYR